MPFRNKIVNFSSPDHQLKIFFESQGAIVTYDPWEDYDVAVFTPGADVSPFLYGAKRLTNTSSDPVRDMRENRFYRDLPVKTPKIGIGRGAQFLNVMAGGTMWQHVTDHAATHYVIDLVTGESITVTSMHHQEMVSTSDAALLAVCNVAQQKRNSFGSMNYDIFENDKKGVHYDTEVVWYDRINALCFQPRPEMGHKMTTDYFLSLVTDWVF